MPETFLSTNEYFIGLEKRRRAGTSRDELAVRKDRYAPPFDEEEVDLINQCFLESNEPSVLAFYLCLNAGISPLEAAVLRFENLDFAKREIRIESGAAIVEKKIVPIPISHRSIPMLDCVYNFLHSRYASMRKIGDYIFTNTSLCAESIRTIETSFRRIIKPRLDSSGVYSASLRSTFIRRCIEANMNMESISSLTGMSAKALYRNYSEFIRADNSAIYRLEKQNIPQERKLNLLILGAGSHGHGVRETAEALGVFQKISFLDDAVEADDVVGKCTDYVRFLAEYPAAFAAFGDNTLRKKWVSALKDAGFIIPRLIHPHATISADAQIGDGTIVLAQATVNAMAKIGESCIIAQNSMIGFHATVGAFSHVNCGGIVMKNANVQEMSIVQSAEVIHGLDAE